MTYKEAWDYSLMKARQILGDKVTPAKLRDLARDIMEEVYEDGY